MEPINKSKPVEKVRLDLVARQLMFLYNVYLLQSSCNKSHLIISTSPDIFHVKVFYDSMERWTVADISVT